MTGGPNREARRAPASPAPASPAQVGPAEEAGSDPGSTTRWRRPGRRAKNPDRGFLIAGAVVKPLMRVWFRIRVEGGTTSRTRGR